MKIFKLTALMMDGDEMAGMECDLIFESEKPFAVIGWLPGDVPKVKVELQPLLLKKVIHSDRFDYAYEGLIQVPKAQDN